MAELAKKKACYEPGPEKNRFPGVSPENRH